MSYLQNYTITFYSMHFNNYHGQQHESSLNDLSVTIQWARAGQDCVRKIKLQTHEQQAVSQTVLLNFYLWPRNWIDCANICNTSQKIHSSLQVKLSKQNLWKQTT